LLADKSQKEKEQIDKVVPDMATVQKELDELERLSAETQAKEATVDKKLEEMLEKEEEHDDDEEDEVADL
jgi:hypothetical protein